MRDDYQWDTIDSSEAKDTVVILGAGASADAGLPIATQLHDKLLNRLGSIYEHLSELVFGNEPVDVERLFRVIQFIHALETDDRPQDNRLEHELLDIGRVVESYKEPLQRYLDGQRDTKRGSPSGDLIDSLWAALGDLLTLPLNADVRYLIYLLLMMRGGTVVTLNYDNALHSATLAASGIQLDDEPLPRSSEPAPGWDPTRAVRVIRLHGALNWAIAPNGAVHAYSPDIRPPVPAIIFGAGNKLRPDGPWLDLYIEFKERLARAQRLIIIGYGWLDAHVNELIGAWVARRDPERILRISSYDTEDIPAVVSDRLGDPPPVVQVITGPAGIKMEELMMITDQLQKRPPSG